MFCTASYFCLLWKEWLPFALKYWHGKQDMEMWEITETLTWSFRKSLFEDSTWTGHVSKCVSVVLSLLNEGLTQLESVWGVAK